MDTPCGGWRWSSRGLPRRARPGGAGRSAGCGRSPPCPSPVAGTGTATLPNGGRAPAGPGWAGRRRGSAEAARGRLQRSAEGPAVPTCHPSAGPPSAPDAGPCRMPGPAATARARTAPPGAARPLPRGPSLQPGCRVAAGAPLRSGRAQGDGPRWPVWRRSSCAAVPDAAGRTVSPQPLRVASRPRRSPPESGGSRSPPRCSGPGLAPTRQTVRRSDGSGAPWTGRGSPLAARPRRVSLPRPQTRAERRPRPGSAAPASDTAARPGSRR
jgi:hypothetical protein